MSLLDVVFTLISEQFEISARGIRSLQLATDSTSEKDWQEESAHLYQKVFTLLAGGKGLPFFRPNYLEISGRVFFFAAGLKQLNRQLTTLPAAPLKSVGECLHNTEKAFSSLRLVWTRFLENSDKACREAAHSLPLIVSLRQSVAQLSSPARLSVETASLCSSWEVLSDCLFEIDLALKKLIAVTKI